MVVSLRSSRSSEGTIPMSLRLTRETFVVWRIASSPSRTSLPKGGLSPSESLRIHASSKRSKGAVSLLNGSITPHHPRMGQLCTYHFQILLRPVIATTSLPPPFLPSQLCRIQPIRRE
ncbi:hypothetical protein M404DRAFT_435409 [Pisolithus tinctorius Marx 270]|uniref:Uncharacterized protein n=1 Tax=Pisolithus tinctorius Marx 270 TaxID=870435 RepID=A0A0C3PF93_PISTI|nr:hypothetical protein M404DRAFT_435409 [Pisolithus tinctorius Marx 270]